MLAFKSKFVTTTKNHFTISKFIFNNSWYKSFTTIDPINPLTTLSPLDGRYSAQLTGLQKYYSEKGLMQYRTIVEIEWLRFLITKVFTPEELKAKFNINQNSITDINSKLDKIKNNFNMDSAEEIKRIEKTTNHDVKAVEYYIKGEMSKLNVESSIHELVHFCCTSEDINNLSWGLIVKDSLDKEYNPKVKSLIDLLVKIAEENSNIAMMARTHGQPATPTTVGKEIANFAYRVNQQVEKLKKIKVKGKFNGAVGNILNYIH